MNSLKDFGFLSSLEKTLKELRLSKTTEIQSQVLPRIMGGQSVVGVSETGSGKTLAYVLPVLHHLKTLEDEGVPVTEVGRPRAVVLVPTRELGEQVSKVFKLFTHDTRLRVRPALGGMAFEQVRRNISSPFEILLATPGRIVQLIDRNLIDLSEVRFLIFDEADQMMDQGFLPDSRLVVAACPPDVQLALFSATVSNTVHAMLEELFSNAEIIRTAKSGQVVETLKTQNLKVEDGKRWPVLENLLKKKADASTIIFTNTREQCDKLAKELTEKGFECVVYRGEMDNNQRRKNLKMFRDGAVKILVATDLGGRGLDIAGVSRVINYHLPKEMQNYLHRVGRTARAGQPGTVINLVTERDQKFISRLKDGEKLKFSSKAAGNEKSAKKSDSVKPQKRASGPLAKRFTAPSFQRPKRRK